MIWNEDFDQKIRTFGFLGVEGKKKNGALWLPTRFRTKTHAAQVNLRKSILDILLGNERNSLGKEQDSWLIVFD